MKAVIFFIFKDDGDNYIEDIRSHLNYDIKQFVVTDTSNLPKVIYNKSENIFHFKDKKTCFVNLNYIFDYLELFNFKEVMLLNVNKMYNADQLIYQNLSNVKEKFSVINNIL
jgi:hypothetical protein